MNVQGNEQKSNTVTASANLLERVVNTAIKLQEVLEQEYQALMGQDLLLVNSLTEEKTVLLESLAHVEPQLRALFNTVEKHAGEEEVEQLLKLCSELNARNRTLVMVAIDQNRKTLSLLRSVLKLGNTSVYSDKGKLNADQSKRYIGKA